MFKKEDDLLKGKQSLQQRWHIQLRRGLKRKTT